MNRIFRLFAAMAIIPVLFSCVPRQTRTNVAYVPSGFFAPAYQILGDAAADSSVYSLNATIRVIRSLELAAQNTGGFEEYMNMIAMQDYRNVAADVLEAQRTLFPVLQKMYLLEQENEKLKGIWAVVTTTEAALVEQSKDYLASAETIPNIAQAVNILPTIVNTAFDSYIKTEKVKDENKAALESLKSEFTESFQESWPVFMKYKEEWERLCIKKDHAYLDVYDGRSASAGSLANEILEAYPDDRDAMIIKALALVEREQFGYEQQIEAESVLDTYMEMYPTRTAPAFLIKGIMASRMGDGDQAFAYFDHAAIEYPRQAVALTDMLDAYLDRPYFSKTHEGLYFRQMYKATLEGYGMFSPNFQKALYYEMEGNHEAAEREIYDHFFRRGNQVVHDYLLSDMEFCEKNLKGVIDRAFPESGQIGLNVVEKKPFLAKNRLDITLENNSEVNLQNVRVYMCYHLVGMYPGDYEVEELSAVNTIPASGTYTWESREYDADDVVYTRAIVLTDDRICWVDSPEYRESNLAARNNAEERVDTLSLPPVEQSVLSLPPAD